MTFCAIFERLLATQQTVDDRLSSISTLDLYDITEDDETAELGPLNLVRIFFS